MAQFTALLVLIIVAYVNGTPTCPKVCQCSEDFTVVNCDKRSITEIPKDIPASAVTLILSHNSLGQIKNQSFPKLPNLTALHLDSSVITGLDPHAFEGLPKLESIFMFGNKIEKIEEASFCGDLPKIESVYLDRNRFTEIPDFGKCSNLKALTLENNQLKSFKFPAGYSRLTKLTRLTLSLNAVSTIKKNDFSALSKARIARLLLSRTGLTSIESGAMKPIAGSLAALKISYNPINSTLLKPIIQELTQCKQLVSLDLDGLQFNSHLQPGIFDPLRNMTLTSLSLNNNQIATIHSGTLSPLVRLINLGLRAAKIETIDPTALQGLNNLHHIDASGNNLAKIPSDLPQSLNDINLSNNRIIDVRDYEFTKQSDLIKLRLDKNAISLISAQAFAGLKKLQILDLSNNAISHIPRLTFSPLRRLKTLNLQKNKLTKITTNVRVFEQLKRLQTLDMSENACETLPYLVFQNLTSLKSLDLSNNRLKYMLENDKYGGTFAGLENLVHLNLQYNDIEVLSPVIFTHLKSLRNLQLSRNRLANWNNELFTFTQQIKFLDLSHNKITIIDQNSLGHNYSNFKTLNLEDNPFSCTCELVWFLDWASKTKVKLVRFDNYTCDSPNNLQGVKLKDFDWRHLICFNYYPYIIGGSVLGGIIVVVLIMSVLYRCRWRISLSYYLCSQRFKSDTTDSILRDEHCPYHAYISYHDKDEDFVQEAIVEPFDSDTNKIYDLCFGARDFQIGSSKIKSMCQSIENSSRAIIVATNHYLSNNRCQMELDYLHSEYVRRSFALIVVTTGPPLKISLLPKWLHNHYSNDRFIEWNEDGAAREEFRQKIDKKLRTPTPYRIEDSIQVNV